MQVRTMPCGEPVWAPGLLAVVRIFIINVVICSWGSKELFFLLYYCQCTFLICLVVSPTWSGSAMCSQRHHLAGLLVSPWGHSLFTWWIHLVWYYRWSSGHFKGRLMPLIGDWKIHFVAAGLKPLPSSMAFAAFTWEFASHWWDYQHPVPSSWSLKESSK